MRSLSRTTSSSSEEMKTTRDAALGELGDGLLDLGLRADVDAARRLVEDQQLGVRREPPAEQHLLLVAAGEMLMGRFGSAGRTLQRVDVLRRRARPAPCAESAAAQPRSACTARMRFSRTLRSPMMPSSRRFSVENAMRLPRPVGRGSEVDLLAVQRQRRPESAGRRRTSSRASSVRPEPRRPAKPTTSPRWISRSVGSIEPRGRGPSPRERRPRCVVALARRGGCRRASESASRSLPIIFEMSCVPIEIAGEVLAHVAAVAQDRDAVADRVDLVEEVRDEQDRDALVAERPDDRKSPSTSAASRLEVGSSRMSTFASVDHRAADRDELLHGDRERRERRVRVEVPRPEPGERLGGGARGSPAS